MEACNAFSFTTSNLITYIDGSTKDSFILSALNEHISHLPYLDKDIVGQQTFMYIIAKNMNEKNFNVLFWVVSFSSVCKVDYWIMARI